MRDGLDNGTQRMAGRTRPAQPVLRRAVEGFQPTPVHLATGRSARFAESIQERYAGRPIPGRRLNLIYQHPAIRWIVQRVLHQSSPSVSLHLALKLATNQVAGGHPMADQRGGQSASRAAHLPMALPVPRESGVGTSPAYDPRITTTRGNAPFKIRRASPQAARMHLGSIQIPRAGSGNRQESSGTPGTDAAAVWKQPMTLAIEPEMAGQMIERRRRVTTSRPTSNGAVAHPVARPVPRVVHRSQPAPERDPPGQRTSPFQQSDVVSDGLPAGLVRTRSSRTPGWPGESTTGISPPSLAPHQVQHLADQVVQIIDGRIIARRERMGRI